jgi:hypothetical protein
MRAFGEWISVQSDGFGISGTGGLKMAIASRITECAAGNTVERTYNYNSVHSSAWRWAMPSFAD